LATIAARTFSRSSTPIRDKIIANGVLHEATLDEHREALAQHLNDPGTTVIDKLLVQCWGHKSR